MELLIVAAIIGILASLAIANYAMFKINAFNTTAAADCRNIAPAADYGSSQSGTPSLILLDGTTSGPIAGLPGASSSPGTLGTIVIDTTTNSYQVTTTHMSGDLCYTIANGTGMVITPAAGGSCA